MALIVDWISASVNVIPNTRALSKGQHSRYPGRSTRTRRCPTSSELPSASTPLSPAVTRPSRSALTASRPYGGGGANLKLQTRQKNPLPWLLVIDFAYFFVFCCSSFRLFNSWLVVLPIFCIDISSAWPPPPLLTLQLSAEAQARAGFHVHICEDATDNKDSAEKYNRYESAGNTHNIWLIALFLLFLAL